MNGPTPPPRKPLATAPDHDMRVHLEQLARERPRAWFSRITFVLVLILLAASWFGGTFDIGELFTERSSRNLERFLREIRPHPLWDRSFDFGIYWDWLQATLADRGLVAIATTLALSVAAIVLAGMGGLLLAVPAAHTLATPNPFLPGSRRSQGWIRTCWPCVQRATRLVLVFLRAIPEYVWAFLLVALIGPGAWPAVLALALHNLGILGKLYGDVVENVDRPVPAAFRGWGSSRKQITAFALLPIGLGRFLLYFFYRWETCVREATVLGLLGVVSLGWYIQDARARTHYDEMLLFVLLGAILILLGDLVSAIARHQIRRH